MQKGFDDDDSLLQRDSLGGNRYRRGNDRGSLRQTRAIPPLEEV